MNAQNYQHLLLSEKEGVLDITLNRPEVRNAMNLRLVEELSAVMNETGQREDVRVIVLRGAEHNFCSGGDIKDMKDAIAKHASSDEDVFYNLNRAFGRMITLVDKTPQVVITLLEGSVLGGGFGLACVSDIAITDNNTQFGMPETSLGLPPAQIIPFVVARIGVTQARRLVLTGSRFDGKVAKELGLVHFLTESEEEMDKLLKLQIAQIKQCAPKANKITKELMHDVACMELESLLDKAAHQFSSAIQSDEAREGTSAFVEKRTADWAK